MRSFHFISPPSTFISSGASITHWRPKEPTRKRTHQFRTPESNPKDMGCYSPFILSFAFPNSTMLVHPLSQSPPISLAPVSWANFSRAKHGHGQKLAANGRAHESSAPSRLLSHVPDSIAARSNATLSAVYDGAVRSSVNGIAPDSHCRWTAAVQGGYAAGLKSHPRPTQALT